MVSDYGSVLESFRPAVSTVLGLDRERARRVLIIGAQIALLLVVLTRLATSSWAMPVALLLVAILGAALVGWVWLYLANSSVALTASHLLITDWRKSATVIARSDVSRLIRIGVKPFEGPPWHAVMGVDAADRSLFTFGGAYDAAAIAGSLSLPLSGSYHDALPLREINRRYPGAVRGVVASPQRILVLSMVGTVVAGLVAFFVWTELRA